MNLLYHKYKYYPYERELALREVTALIGDKLVTEIEDGFVVPADTDISRLVYFSKAASGSSTTETIQARLERAAKTGTNRQATRYSVHGLHEYKGKFNPQVAKAILNIFGITPGANVLDPFCGSGTSLVECTQIGAVGTGIDINPLAVFIANAKLRALATPASVLHGVFDKIERRLWDATPFSDKTSPERDDYLASWFLPEQLSKIERVRGLIELEGGDCRAVLLTIASNLLRDYSMQDPGDLRIRRRTSPMPDEDFRTAFMRACRAFSEKLAEAQKVVGVIPSSSAALLGSSVSGLEVGRTAQFDAAITSPPYAMALPYIDTQRLSLVWLGLLPASRILGLESELVGSRELRGNARKTLVAAMHDNTASIPVEQHALCTSLQEKLTASDGFRRKAVPILLYRYFCDMLHAFRNIQTMMKRNAPFALIVGHNHTNLGGARQDIDTPHHLSSIALMAGWRLEEQLPLQTYRRYGYHSSNAVGAETLIILRNS
ncbi:putative RNA methylase [Mesorhizobium metallidurans STM 2683]|uniref:Putative RNA methylase n=1 Tax=Mesorhizobium metallidurans STM 2683 TaxID=1297569 RepID=M5EG42_9HYPH|nr:DNA methyltransferase [Mesorhizobium metallidurans]CCV03312.1 putative RNA methylase [Mesorhizobium metallidurans STM 2683]